MTRNPNPNEPTPHEGSQFEDAAAEDARSDAPVPMPGSSDFVDTVRKRFKELAASCVQSCALEPEVARAVLHTLELGLAQTIKEFGPALRQKFGRDVQAAVSWASERLVEACRRLARETPGHNPSPLQKLAILEIQVLERMVPELSRTQAVEPVDVKVPTAQLRSFCTLLNDGLDFAEKAETAAGRRDQRAYQGNYVLSRNKFRNAARVLRRLLHAIGSETSDLAEGLHGFQLELAAHTGSIRMFLKALRARKVAAHLPGEPAQVWDPHCPTGELLATLFDRHFAFTIYTPRGIPSQQSQELITASHGAMWHRVGDSVSSLLDQPGKLHTTEFKDVVEAELRKAIDEVNQQFAAEQVTIQISSNDVRQIRRREL